MARVVKVKKRFPRKPCGYCGEMFQPVVGHQDYCRDSHRIEAFRERKFQRAVEAEVEKRLRQHKASLAQAANAK